MYLFKKNNSVSAACDKTSATASATTVQHGADSVSSVPTTSASTSSQAADIKKHCERERQLVEELEQSKTTSATLREHCKEKQMEIDKLYIDITTKNNCMSKYTNRISKLQERLESITKKQLKAEKDLRSMRSGALYKKLKRKAQRLDMRDACDCKRHNCESKVVQIASLKRYIKSLQTAKSHQKILLETNMDFKSKQRKELNSMKGTVLKLESELISVQDDTDNKTFKTRTEGHGHPFTDSIEKCVMQFVGECDIPATKCAEVIQSVAKWIFDKDIHLSDLPSSSTAVNMMDRAQVLAKHQVAEEILGSSRWDLHSDGTSRDTKKFMGCQVTLDSGKSLSAGFTSIATEDSATVLDNAISMMHELSDLYNSEEEKTFKTILEKMFATMSDRCTKIIQ